MIKLVIKLDTNPNSSGASRVRSMYSALVVQRLSLAFLRHLDLVVAAAAEHDLEEWQESLRLGELLSLQAVLSATAHGQGKLLTHWFVHHVIALAFISWEALCNVACTIKMSSDPSVYN